MKMNIKGLVFVGFAAAVFASAANAASDKTVTSKTYVDAKYIAAENGNITITPNTTTDKNEISADVPLKGIQVNGQDQAINANKKVNLGAAAGKGVDTTITSTAADTAVPTSKAVYDYIDDEIGELTTYTNGTNITFTPGENDGDPVTISTPAEVNVLEGITVGGTAVTLSNKVAPLGAAAGKAVDTTITSTAADTAVPTSKAVYDFLNNGAATANCSDTNPCAFVLGSDGVPEWKPIAQ